MQGKLRALRTWFVGRKKITCTHCNGFGGHFDGFDIQDCKRCGGEGEL